MTMCLTHEELEAILPEPMGYFGHSSLCPMYTKEEMLSFASRAIDWYNERLTKQRDALLVAE